MDLTPRQRDLISRACATAAGVLLCYWCWCCAKWGWGSWNDETTQRMITHNNSVREARGTVGLILLLLVPFGLSLLLGLLGLALIGVGVFRFGADKR